MLLAIDPGPEQSAWLLYDGTNPVDFEIVSNDVVLDRIVGLRPARLAVESVASYGMAVGAEVFETCVWTGRFIQRWRDIGEYWGGGQDEPVHRVYRRDVKLHLCGSSRAKDANVRQALTDRLLLAGAVAVDQGLSDVRVLRS